MKKALVTGATGFVGFHLCKRLYQEGYFVIASGRKKENSPYCHELHLTPLDKLPFTKFGKIDICFHQAANNNTLEENHDIMLQANVIEPFTLFDNLLQQNNCRNFIYASSCSIYGNQPTPFVESKTTPKPLNVYAESKLQFENKISEFSNKHQVKTVGLRYSNVYGSHEGHKGKRASMVYQILQKNLNRQVIELFTNGQQLRDWIHINDVVDANIKASNYHESGIFNVGSGKPCSFNHLVETISRVTNIHSDIKYIPCNFTEKYQFHTSVDLTKSNNELQFYPEISVLEGIRMMI